jgi:hypothetical protein
MPQIGRKRERRRYTRSPIGKTVPVLWEDGAGQERLMQGRLIDVSVSGAKILVPLRLPERTVVSFNCLTLAVGGRGTVRYCHTAKGGYEVGLELPNGTGWRDQNKDLQNLAAAVDRSNLATQSSDVPKTASDVSPKT